MTKAKDKDVLKCAMAWQSIADALGNDFEFAHNIDPAEVRKEINAKGHISITDDTQMAFFGMRALRSTLENDWAVFSERIRIEYENWYITQTSRPERFPTLPDVLFRRRAPGMACMKSMKEWVEGTRRPNQSRGCGAVMRLAPFNTGLVEFDKAFLYSKQSGRVTHDHPDTQVAIAQYVEFAHAALHMGLPSLEREGHGVTRKILQANKISDLGAGFYADEAVNMAIWAVLHAEDGEDMLIKAIAHNGDSDSVGAIAASLWGIATKKMPPVKLLRRVVEWPIIEEEVDLLTEAAAHYVKVANPTPAKGKAKAPA